MAETLFIGQEAHLQGMDIFEIGGNKNYINYGLMTSQVSSIEAQLDSISSDTKNLVIPGYVLELLENSDDGILSKLKSIVKKNNLSLLAVPFYNSSLSIISSEELKSQLDLQEKIIAKHFGKNSCKGFFCGEGILPPSVEKVLNKKYSSVYYPSNSYLTLDNPKYKLIETSVSSIGQAIPKSLATSDSRMEAHLISELSDLYPHIISFGDSDSLTSWRFMTQSSMISKSNVDTFSNDAYSHYMNMMNTLNDLANKINAVNLAKQGLFQEKPTITSSPSSLISSLEVTKNGC